jgi:hypothetical protein
MPTVHFLFLIRFYGQSEDGDEFNDSIRQLFLAFNTLMDRPLEEAVKIKVSLVTLWGDPLKAPHEDVMW